MVKVTLKDGSVREYEDNVTLLEVAKSLSQKLGKQALLAVVDGQNKDLSDKLSHDASVEFVVPESEEGLHAIRHTAAHVMAQAIQHLFPDVKFAIGPAIANGFYYDLDSEHVFTPEDLAAIEKEMAKIIKANIPLVRAEIPRAEALKMFEEKNEKYKVELINDLPEDAIISTYTQGDFTDLCAGPHCPSTGRVKAFKLQSIAGAYWRGDEHNKMLQRIYGTAFPSKEELDAYLHMLEEAAKRDHRKLGKELDLFSIQDEGPGFPFFHPNGMIIKNTLIDYWREVHRRYGYYEIQTPMILSRTLWERSGHWDHYRDNMYFTKIDEADYAVKPMNCPGGLLVYKQGIKSYRDLPLRMAEFGKVNRYEASGALMGLMRVREFTQDDAHIFCTPEQMEEECITTMKLIFDIYKDFGFDKIKIYLSTRPEKRIGSDEIWDISEKSLASALEKHGYEYEINEGEGAFYGPKLEFILRDAIGREWQCGTIQVDMNLPQRFDISYIGEDGEKHQPVMLHRALFGSIERFLGILIEHHAGKLPLWLSPEQVVVMPVTSAFDNYAEDVAKTLRAAGLTAKTDLRNEKINYKIREHSVEKIPVIMVVGAKEEADKTVTIRRLGSEKQEIMPLAEAVAALAKEAEMPHKNEA